MADRDPQIENIKDPKLQALARQARAEITLDFGMTSHSGVNLTFAELVRQETRQELKAEAAAAASTSPKTRAP